MKADPKEGSQIRAGRAGRRRAGAACGRVAMKAQGLSLRAIAEISHVGVQSVLRAAGNRAEVA